MCISGFLAGVWKRLPGKHEVLVCKAFRRNCRAYRKKTIPMRDRRVHDRIAVAFQVSVTVVTNPELTATGEAQDISRSGLGVFLPIPLPAGSLVRVDIADSVLYGFIAHSEEWPILSKPSFARNKVWSETITEGDNPPERRYHTGIDIVEVAMGTSGLSQLLKTTLEETLPNIETSSSTPAR
jgi:hypothetical protein